MFGSPKVQMKEKKNDKENDFFMFSCPIKYFKKN